jgi:hypothetical protein
MYSTTGTANVNSALYHSRFGYSEYGSTSSPFSWGINGVLFIELPLVQINTTSQNMEKYYLSRKDFTLLRQSVEESPKPNSALRKLFDTHCS